MNICHKKLLVVTTFLLGVPIIYEYQLHPLMGFLMAFLFSWMIWEDYESKLVDMRVAAALGLLVIIFRSSWIAVLTGVFFISMFQCLFYGFARFEQKTDTLSYDTCPLQQGCFTGFIPLLGAAAWLYCMTDMIFNPLNAILLNSVNGSFIAIHLVHVHIYCKEIRAILESNPWIFLVIIGGMLFLLLFLRRRAVRKGTAGLQATYPMGDGDPYVMGILAALCGAESFFYVVLMGSLLLGELFRGFYAILQKRGTVHE